MSRIPFIEARILDPDETRIHIEHRLLGHQRKLRAARLMSLRNNSDVEGADLDLLIGEQTTRTITRRAKRLLPLLLDGPPGIGKSHWARRLGMLLSTPVTVIEATGESASPGMVGSQRGWGGARGLSETALATLIEVLEGAPARPHLLSLRTVIRLLERAADRQNAPTRH